MSPTPCQIGDQQLFRYQQVESLLYFIKKQAGEESSDSTVPGPIPAASPAQTEEPTVATTPVQIPVSLAGDQPMLQGTSPKGLAPSTPVAQCPNLISLEDGQQQIPLSQLTRGLGLWTGQLGSTAPWAEQSRSRDSFPYSDRAETGAGIPGSIFSRSNEPASAAAANPVNHNGTVCFYPSPTADECFAARDSRRSSG